MRQHRTEQPEAKAINRSESLDHSRRAFLNTAGCAAIGGLAVAAGSSLLSSRNAAAAEQAEAPPLPWKYEKLDPMEAGKRGYENYLAQGG